VALLSRWTGNADPFQFESRKEKDEGGMRVKRGKNDGGEKQPGKKDMAGSQVG